MSYATINDIYDLNARLHQRSVKINYAILLSLRGFLDSLLR